MSCESSIETPNNSLWGSIPWQPSINQIESFIKLQKLIQVWNQQVNLTRLTIGNDYWICHIFDSLWPFSKELTDPYKPRSCIDIGTGCGFPGLAIAIALPGTHVTLVDSVGKKTNALKSITAELGLSSRTIFRNERIEQTGHDALLRGSFDLALARAVASTPVVAEYLIPLIKPNGEALIFKGNWSQRDEQQLKNALIPLKGKIKNVQNRTLPDSRGIRHLIRIKQTELCPIEYPRAIGKPSKYPLGN